MPRKKLRWIMGKLTVCFSVSENLRARYQCPDRARMSFHFKRVNPEV